MVQIPLEEKNTGEGYWRLCNLMGWILSPRNSIFLPSFYTFFRGKGIINVKCYYLVITIVCMEEASGEGSYRTETS